MVAATRAVAALLSAADLDDVEALFLPGRGALQPRVEQQVTHNMVGAGVDDAAAYSSAPAGEENMVFSEASLHHLLDDEQHWQQQQQQQQQQQEHRRSHRLVRLLDGQCEAAFEAEIGMLLEDLSWALGRKCKRHPTTPFTLVPPRRAACSLDLSPHAELDVRAEVTIARLRLRALMQVWKRAACVGGSCSRLAHLRSQACAGSEMQERQVLRLAWAAFRMQTCETTARVSERARLRHLHVERVRSALHVGIAHRARLQAMAALQAWRAAASGRSRFRGPLLAVKCLGGILLRRHDALLTLHVFICWAWSCRHLCEQQQNVAVRSNSSALQEESGEAVSPCSGHARQDVQDSAISPSSSKDMRARSGQAIASVLSRQLECFMRRQCIAVWRAIAERSSLKSDLMQALLENHAGSEWSRTSVGQLRSKIDRILDGMHPNMGLSSRAEHTTSPPRAVSEVPVACRVAASVACGAPVIFDAVSVAASARLVASVPDSTIGASTWATSDQSLRTEAERPLSWIAPMEVAIVWPEAAQALENAAGPRKRDQIRVATRII